MPKAKTLPDQHSNAPTRIAMGIEADLMVRLERPIKRDLVRLYKDVYGEAPGATQARFVGYVLARGIAAIREQHLPARRIRRIQRPA